MLAVCGKSFTDVIFIERQRHKYRNILLNLMKLMTILLIVYQKNQPVNIDAGEYYLNKKHPNLTSLFKFDSVSQDEVSSIINGISSNSCGTDHIFK